MFCFRLDRILDCIFDYCGFSNRATFFVVVVVVLVIIVVKFNLFRSIDLPFGVQKWGATRRDTTPLINKSIRRENGHLCVVVAAVFVAVVEVSGDRVATLNRIKLERKERANRNSIEY